MYLYIFEKLNTSGMQLEKTIQVVLLKKNVWSIDSLESITDYTTGIYAKKFIRINFHPVSQKL